MWAKTIYGIDDINKHRGDMGDLTRALAGRLSRSFVFAGARRLYAANEANFWLPLTKFQKLYAGCYVILADYSGGEFPPRFEDQRAAYDAEIRYRESLPGVDEEAIAASEMRKPFGFGNLTYRYLRATEKLLRLLQALRIEPPATMVELGCGSGWLAEWLAQMGFDVQGTTISPTDVREARRRVASLEARGLDARLQFIEAPMESVTVERPVDVVYVFEALHHAYDWERTFDAAWKCLKPGGWLLICNEPNLIHTCVSYRVGKLSNTHEIGLSRAAMVRHLRGLGAREVRSFGTAWHCWIWPHWLAVRRPEAG